MPALSASQEWGMHFWTGFTSGWLLIGLSELGDKTFFIGAILAMRHPRWWVFLGVIGGLATMTLVSVGMGQVAALFPQRYVRGLAVALFLGFGFKLLYDASRMSGQATLADEEQEALAVVERQERGKATWSAGAVVMEAFTLTFVAEWGLLPLRWLLPIMLWGYCWGRLVVMPCAPPLP